MNYLQLKLNIIKLSFIFSRRDAKAQSLKSISLRLRVSARARFIKIWQEILNLMTLDISQKHRSFIWLKPLLYLNYKPPAEAGGNSKTFF